MIPLVVQAPMAGGVSTPELAAAVSGAGGLGFLAAGYRSPDQVRQDLRDVRTRTDRPVALNILSVVGGPVGDAVLDAYAEELEPDARRYGVTLERPPFDDDDRAEKLALAAEEDFAVVSFAFSCPSGEEVERLQASGTEVWITVTEADEALLAAEAGADALVVQGIEAGGHRGSFDDADGRGETGLDELLRQVGGETDLPLVAAGGIMDREGIAAAREAGATAVQLGTAFMLCPEASTPPSHRAAFRDAGATTAVTRAFTGRRARGIVNRFMRDHPHAPSAYPQIGALTTPIRQASKAADDGEAFQLWAGTNFRRAKEIPAARLVQELAR